MRILHLTIEYPPIIYGGIGTSLNGLVNASASSGSEIFVLVVSQRSFANTVNKEDLVNANSKNIKTMYISYDKSRETIVKLVTSWKPDIIHLHSSTIWGIAKQLLRFNIPIIYTMESIYRAEFDMGHGPDEFTLRAKMQEQVISSVHRIIVLSHSEFYLFIHYYPMFANKVRIVGFGISDCGVNHSAMQKDDKFFTILYVGRFAQRKGITDLFQTIPKILKEIPNARFILVGGLPNRDINLVRQWWFPNYLNKYYHQIIFTGWISYRDIVKWYHLADIQVVPSWYEPFGLVVLEGMRHGLPIIASNVGGPSEILRHKKTGLLIPSNDSETLLSAITWLHQNKEEGNKLGKEALKEVKNKWLWSNVIKDFQKAYEELTV